MDIFPRDLWIRSFHPSDHTPAFLFVSDVPLLVEPHCTLLHYSVSSSLSFLASLHYITGVDVQDDTKKRELVKNPTKLEEIQEKKILTEIEPLQLAF